MTSNLELFDQTHPGAHLAQTMSLTPRSTTTLQRSLPYPAPPRRPEQPSTDMSRSKICASNVTLPCALKASTGPRRLSGSFVTCGAGVEESRKGPKVVFF